MNARRADTRDMTARRRARELDVLLTAIEAAVRNGIISKSEGLRQRRKAYAQNRGVAPVGQAPDVAATP